MFAILVIINVILFALLTAAVCGLYRKNANVICKSRKRLDGKTTLITGGTTGMGLELAKDFAARGARVIIACPFQGEGDKALKDILLHSENKNVLFKILDLGSIESVRSFASDIINTEDRLDILMNNAGVGIPADFLTKDGMNFIMQVNYFGPFLLTLLLLPLLIKTGTPAEPSRIVNTSSMLHTIGLVDIDNLNSTGYWYKTRIYGNSKLCLIHFSRSLTGKLKEVKANVVVNAVDPGAVGTRIFEQAGWLEGKISSFIYMYLSKTPWEGIQTAMHVALDSKAGDVSGEFFRDCRVVRAISAAYDDNIAVRLWDESVRLVKLKSKEIEQCFMAECKQ